MHKALKSFSGIISMHEGETREINDADVVDDLLKAGYIEEVKPKRGRSTKKSGDANPQE
jgi:hypothetical protein